MSQQITASFGSVSELVEAVRATRIVEKVKAQYFTGRYFASWEQALSAATEPWPEGAEDIKKLSEQLQAQLPQPRSRKRKAKWDADHGDEIDQTRSWNGDDPWRRTVRQVLPGVQTVVIAVNISALAVVSWTELRWRGIAAVVLTDVLERAGYRVEIRGCRVAELTDGPNKGKEIVLDYLLKSSSDPLEIDSLASACSTWFYRTAILQLNVAHGAHFGASNTKSIKGRFAHLAGRDCDLIEIDGCDSECKAEELIENVLKNLD